MADVNIENVKSESDTTSAGYDEVENLSRALSDSIDAKFGMFTSTLLALACCVGGTFSTGGYPDSSNGHYQPLAISSTFVDKGLVEAELKDGDEDKDHAHLGNPVIANRHHQILVSTSNQTSAMVA